MFNSKVLHTLAAVGMLAFGGMAHAQVASYNFGSFLTGSSGYTSPDFSSNPFAHLDVLNISTDGNVWTFKLSVHEHAFDVFGENAYIGSMSFDYEPDPVGKVVSTIVASNSDGVTVVYSTSGTGASGLPEVDFGTKFGKKSSRNSTRQLLNEDDYVIWTVSGLIGSNYSNMYVHVQGIGSKGYSAKYTPLPGIPTSPVPEPETYAMLLAGLGMLGLVSRRRKQNS